MIKVFTWAPKIMWKKSMGKFWINQSSCTHYVFYILQEVDAERKVAI